MQILQGKCDIPPLNMISVGHYLLAIRLLKQLFRRCGCYFVVVLFPDIELFCSITDIRRAWYGIHMKAVPSFG